VTEVVRLADIQQMTTSTAYLPEQQAPAVMLDHAAVRQSTYLQAPHTFAAIVVKTRRMQQRIDSCGR
jgi:hypothetical protein